ncbi:YebG family protein [Ferrimonas balearica]|uniref:YebG family protein n=1 Tax=Ferrimonas balearica TaxID=44012 RepID=UPI001F437819|nr:YebG family protein [Ferrimonas balearica]MBY6094888.1 YebG family protein [Ferrimonas balearica]
MAVIVKYVVERDGEERMTFSTKAEADAYDKMLDLAESLEPMLAQSTLVEEEKLEELALFLAERKVELMALLKGGKAAKQAAKPVAKASKASKAA